MANGEPARTTCAPLTKPLPFAMIVKAPVGIEAGARLVSTGSGFSRVTLLLLNAVASAELTARTVTTFALGTVAGAEYRPIVPIVVVAALPPVTPFTCQLTDVLEDPPTVALKD